LFTNLKDHVALLLKYRSEDIIILEANSSEVNIYN